MMQPQAVQLEILFVKCAQGLEAQTEKHELKTPFNTVQILEFQVVRLTTLVILTTGDAI